MGAPQIKNIAATTETLLNKSPFLVANPIHYNSVAGATLYGVNLAGRDARSGNYQRWLGDGSTVQWNKNTVVNLTNADYSTPSAADWLRVVAMVNGAPLHRVLAASVPTTGQFSVTNGARGVAAIRFIGLPADAVKVTLIDASAQTTIFEFDPSGDGVTTGNVDVDTAADTTAAAVAATFVAAVNAVTTTCLITARDMGSGLVMLYQDTPGVAGNSAITVSSATAITAPTVFAGGVATGTTAIQFGDVHADDSTIEIFLAASASIATKTLTANTPTEAPGYQVVYATAASQAIRLTR